MSNLMYFANQFQPVCISLLYSLNNYAPIVLHSLDNLVHNISVNLPLFEDHFINGTLFILDVCFDPKQIIKQVVFVWVIQLSLMANVGIGHLWRSFINRVTVKGRKLAMLSKQMTNARTYGEWRSLAEEEDRVKGFDEWKQSQESSFCNCYMLKRRINEIRGMIRSNSIFNMIFRLRGGLSRDQYGMQHEGLYTRARGGTKAIIEKYNDTVVKALDVICDSSVEDDQISSDVKLAFFNETRHSYGRSALLLSGGGCLGYYHTGVVKALFEARLLPRVISGASAGSIMASIIGTRRDNELSDLLGGENFRRDTVRFNWDNQQNFLSHSMFPAWLKKLGNSVLNLFMYRQKMLQLDTDHLKKVMIENIGEYTFQEAFDRTGRITNITVAPLNDYDPPRLLNYLTSPHVCVWSAAAASCAIPGAYQPLTLVVKEPDGTFAPEHIWSQKDDGTSIAFGEYTDGSVENDLPMQQISELFNVNHFIVSQVNPHSSVLSSLTIRASVWSAPLFGTFVGYLRFLKAQCRDWLRNVLDLFMFRSMNPYWGMKRGSVLGMSLVLVQDYEGRPNDITIMPWAGHRNPVMALLNSMSNPSKSQYDEMSRVGERNTYPFIARIKAQCSIEHALDRCVQRLRHRILLESSGNEACQDKHASNYRDRNSFFAVRSGSLTKMSSLNVSDPPVDVPPPPAAPSSSLWNDESEKLKRVVELNSTESLSSLAHTSSRGAMDASTAAATASQYAYEQHIFMKKNYSTYQIKTPTPSTEAYPHHTDTLVDNYNLSGDNLASSGSEILSSNATGSAPEAHVSDGNLPLRNPSMASFYYRTGGAAGSS